MTLKIVPLIMISCCKGNDLCKPSQALKEKWLNCKNVGNCYSRFTMLRTVRRQSYRVNHWADTVSSKQTLQHSVILAAESLSEQITSPWRMMRWDLYPWESFCQARLESEYHPLNSTAPPAPERLRALWSSHTWSWSHD